MLCTRSSSRTGRSRANFGEIQSVHEINVSILRWSTSSDTHGEWFPTSRHDPGSPLYKRHTEDGPARMLQKVGGTATVPAPLRTITQCDGTKFLHSPIKHASALVIQASILSRAPQWPRRRPQHARLAIVRLFGASRRRDVAARGRLSKNTKRLTPMIESRTHSKGAIQTRF